MPSSPYHEDEGEDSDSPLFGILHQQFKPQPFDPSPARADDIAMIAEAMKLHPGREKMGIGAARQIVALQRDRERRVEVAKKAKAKRLTAKRQRA